MSSTPSSAEIEQAAALLRAGRLVVFPTETVYGLGANALDPKAVARIYAVKRRPPTSPLIVHVASIEMAQSLVANWPETADKLAKRFWPGPLTLVLPKKSGVTGVPLVHLKTNGATGVSPVEAGRSGSASAGSGLDSIQSEASFPEIPPIVTARLPTVGLRMPDHPIALALIQAAGLPLAAPSANRFTEVSPTTAEHVRRGLGSDVDMILDGGPCQVGIESTVLSLSADQPILLRPGGVSRSEIEGVIGPIESAQEIPGRELLRGAHPSPGMHPRHYSPRTPLLLVSDGKLPEQGKGIYLQYATPPSTSGSEPPANIAPPAHVTTIQMPLDSTAYAAQLYDELHQADEANADWIAVDEPPATPEWEAVMDRLKRAATGENDTGASR